jgi:dienelactone hydrolase
MRGIAAILSYWLAASVAAQAPASGVSTETVQLAGVSVKVDVYRPYERGAAPGGVAIVAHGFTRDRTYGRELARDLADAGIVAIAPDLPNVVDYAGSGDAVVDLVRDVERGSLGLPPAPRERIVLIGTSAGGVGTLIAASMLPGLAGWIGLDPVDRSGLAAGAAETLEAPAVVLLGEPSVCNLFGSGRDIAAAARTLVRVERVRGASHCDFEGPTTKFCRTVCGKSAGGMAATVRAEAVRAARRLLVSPAARVP